MFSAGKGDKRTIKARFELFFRSLSHLPTALDGKEISVSWKRGSKNKGTTGAATVKGGKAIFLGGTGAVGSGGLIEDGKVAAQMGGSGRSKTKKGSIHAGSVVEPGQGFSFEATLVEHEKLKRYDEKKIHFVINEVTGKKHVKELYKADLDMGDGSVAANNTNVVKDIFFADSKSHKKKGASLTGKPPTLAIKFKTTWLKIDGKLLVKKSGSKKSDKGEGGEGEEYDLVTDDEGDNTDTEQGEGSDPFEDSDIEGAAPAEDVEALKKALKDLKAKHKKLQKKSKQYRKEAHDAKKELEGKGKHSHEENEEKEATGDAKDDNEKDAELKRLAEQLDIKTKKLKKKKLKMISLLENATTKKKQAEQEAKERLEEIERLQASPRGEPSPEQREQFLTAIREVNAKLSEELDKEKERVKELEETKDQLFSSGKEVESRKAALERKDSESQSQIADLTAQLKNIQSEAEEAKKDRDRYGSELAEAKRVIADKDSEIDGLKSETVLIEVGSHGKEDTLRKELANEKEEREKERASLVKAKEDTEEESRRSLLELQGKLEAAENVVAGLKSEIEGKSKAEEDLKDRLQVKTKELEEKKEELAAEEGKREEDREQLKKEREDSREAIAQLKGSLEREEELKREAEERTEGLERKLAKAESDLKEMEETAEKEGQESKEKVEVLEKSLREARAVVRDEMMEEFSVATEELRGMLEALKAELQRKDEQAKKDLAAGEARKEEMGGQIAALQGQLAEAKEENTQLVEAKKAVEEEREKAAKEWKQRVDAKQEELDSVKIKLDEMGKQADGQEGRNSGEDIAELRIALMKETNEKERLHQELAEVTVAIGVSQKELKQKTELVAQRDKDIVALQEDVRRQTEQANNVVRASEEKDRALQEAVEKNDSKDKEIAKLKEKVGQKDKRIEQQELGMAAELAAVKASLEERQRELKAKDKESLKNAQGAEDSLGIAKKREDDLAASKRALAQKESEWEAERQKINEDHEKEIKEIKEKHARKDKDAVESVGITSEETESLRESLNAKEQELTDTKALIAQHQQEAQEAKDKLSQREAEWEAQRGQLQGELDRVNSEGAQVGAGNAAQAELQAALEDERIKVAQKDAEIQRLGEIIEENKAALDRTQKENEEAKRAAAAIAPVPVPIVASAAPVKEVESLQNQISLLTGEKDQLAAELHKKDEDLQQGKEQVENLQTMLAKAKRKEKQAKKKGSHHHQRSTDSPTKSPHHHHSKRKKGKKEANEEADAVSAVSAEAPAVPSKEATEPQKATQQVNAVEDGEKEKEKEIHPTEPSDEEDDPLASEVLALTKTLEQREVIERHIFRASRRSYMRGARNDYPTSANHLFSYLAKNDLLRSGAGETASPQPLFSMIIKALSASVKRSKEVVESQCFWLSYSTSLLHLVLERIGRGSGDGTEGTKTERLKRENVAGKGALQRTQSENGPPLQAYSGAVEDPKQFGVRKPLPLAKGSSTSTPSLSKSTKQIRRKSVRSNTREESLATAANSSSSSALPLPQKNDGPIDLEEFLRQLQGRVILKVFSHLLEELKARLSPILPAAILEHQATDVVTPVRSPRRRRQDHRHTHHVPDDEKDDGQAASNNNKITAKPSDVKKVMGEVMDQMVKKHVFPRVVQTFFIRLFGFMDVVLFNSLMDESHLCTCVHALQIKMGLSELMAWLHPYHQSGAPDASLIDYEATTKQLSHITEAVNVLVMEKSIFTDQKSVRLAFPHLYPIQILHLLYSFHPDEISRDGVPEEGKQLLRHMVSLASDQDDVKICEPTEALG